LGFDNKVHSLDSNAKGYYSDMSIWDIHRTQVPFLTLIAPEILRDIVVSLIDMFTQGGDLPRWPLANGYTNCMIGTHANIIIADAIFKGITNFDIQTAFKGMLQSATQTQKHAGRDDIEDWIKRGYIIYDNDNTSTSKTLEYSYDDWAVGRVAGYLNHSDIETLLLNRSKNYKNVWHAQEKYFCPRRAAGDFDCPSIKEDVFDKRYIEGDANHWRWFVPHDVPGLIELFGSKELFASELDKFFEYSKLYPSNFMPNPWYWAGNEPDIFSMYMNVYARPDFTQKAIRWLVEHKYTTKPDGIPGNDDYGTMSSWFLFSSFGFYPLSGSATYLIGSPLYDSVTIHRGDGDIKIIAHNNSPKNIYVQKVIVNGQTLTEPFLDHNKHFKGGCTLEFFMDNKPAKF